MSVREPKARKCGFRWAGRLLRQHPSQPRVDSARPRTKGPMSHRCGSGWVGCGVFLNGRGIVLNGPIHAKARKRPAHSHARSALKGQSLTFAAPPCSERCTQNRPRKTRSPRSERFCLGKLGGAGGTRTQTSDASHLRGCQNYGHSRPFPSGCVLVDPARTGVGAAFAAPLPPRPSQAQAPARKGRSSLSSWLLLPCGPVGFAALGPILPSPQSHDP